MAIKIPEPRYNYDAEKLAEQYKKAVEKIMNDLKNSDPKGYSKAFQAAQLKEISDILSELNDESAKWVEEHIPEAAREGTAVTLYAAGIVGSIEEARKIVKFSTLNERMVASVIADTQQDLLAVTQNVEKRVRNAIRSTSADVMRRNMAAGINGTRTNRRDILTDLRSQLGSALDTGIVDAAGRRWKPHVYVNMLVQTKMMYAHTESTMNEALERGIQYATISSHGATDACRQWEGKVVKLVPDAPGSYPTVAAAKASRQIFHPNCKHLIVPIRNPDGILSNKIDEGAVEDVKIKEKAPKKSADQKPKAAEAKTPKPPKNPKYVDLGYEFARGARKHMDPLYADDYKQHLTKKHISAIKKYQGSSYRDINDQLRHPEYFSGGSKNDSIIEDLRSAIAAVPLKENMIVYRGIGSGYGMPDFDNIMGGEIIKDPAFLSTSTSRAAATQFFKTEGAGRGYVLKIRVPKGHRAVFVDTAIDENWESELLLKEGTKMIVTSKRDYFGTPMVEVDIIPD